MLFDEVKSICYITSTNSNFAICRGSIGEFQIAKFIGRQRELSSLMGLLAKRSASLIVIKGRRRIGKTRLLEQFGKNFKRTIVFSGIPPTKETTPQSQKDEFSRQLARNANIPGLQSDDWGDLFWHLAMNTQIGQTLIIFDEITWMGNKDHLFLGKLKNAWDLYFKKNDQLILALCGSISSWIEENILNSTGFFGRFSLNMTLEELPLQDCIQFWPKKNKGIDIYEKLKFLSVAGGIPRYLEHMNPILTAEENIHNLCFSKEGALYKEFDRIFSDLFSKKSKFYENIVRVLADGASDQGAICKKLKIKQTGDIAKLLDDLIQSGFVSRDYTWHLKNGEPSKLSVYRLKDNYSRFYLKYIQPQIIQIESGNIQLFTLANLKGWQSIMGLQVENLVLANRNLIKAALNILPNDVICDNPFFQRATTKQLGCQIDYLIHTKFNVLYICEIKYSTKPISQSIISQMDEKIKRMKIPKGFSYRAVLIHVNGVSDKVEDSDYFSSILDLGELIQV